MIELRDEGVFLKDGYSFVSSALDKEDKAEGIKRTMAYKILEKHNKSQDMENLKITFDALVSPDNNYVSILQTARASGIKEFPVPYILSNCHHSLCAAGGTINEDDHVFGLGNVKKYGGIFLPPYTAVIHQYMREMMAGGEKMILGSDSHTRYGVLGTLGIGEGGGEVVKQLLKKTYDIKRPEVIAVKLTGKPRPGVGPQDVALALIGATFKKGFVKNKILEFLGEGIFDLSIEYRMGIDVMTTEAGALSSIWCTDEKVREYLKIHGRENEYKELMPQSGAYYEGMIEIDLSEVECMIALPFHPSNVISIKEFKSRMNEIIAEIEEEGQRVKGKAGSAFVLKDKIRDNELWIDQALVGGCSGGMFENISTMADILRGGSISGEGIGLSINPASQPIMMDLMNKGIAGELMTAGAVFQPAICGPCFGVTHVPADNQLSIRHMTRNYFNREGSKSEKGQMAAVALMDARSIAATVLNGGRLTAATELDVKYSEPVYEYNKDIYRNRVYDNYQKSDETVDLKMGPNIGDWPKMYPLGKHLLLKVAGAYKGSVTTDELTPSGEASSYRSNPEKISEYTLINKDKEYVERAKKIRELEAKRRQGGGFSKEDDVVGIIGDLCKAGKCFEEDVMIGSVIVSEEIGDGSSREQAASCQKVLGGMANIANAYSTKRYRSNLINWGILPFETKETIDLKEGQYIFVKNIAEKIAGGDEKIDLEILGNPTRYISCSLGYLTEDEKNILISGSIINFYK